MEDCVVYMFIQLSCENQGKNYLEQGDKVREKGFFIIERSLKILLKREIVIYMVFEVIQKGGKIGNTETGPA